MRLSKFLVVISFILMVEGLSSFLCIPVGVYFHEPLSPFIWSSVVALFFGSVMYLLSDKKLEFVSGAREGFILIVVSWIVIILTGTLPYLLSNTVLKLVDVLFETTSGFTTTGSSILSQPEYLPKSILFWRSLTHWQGGYFTLLMLVFIFPVINIRGNNPFVSSIQSNEIGAGQIGLIRKITLVYSGISILLGVLLFLGKMDFFDGLCYAFATVSTGSFVPGTASTADYSVLVQVILMVFMLLSGVGYYAFVVFLMKKRLSKSIRHEVLFFFMVIVIIATIVCTGLFELTNTSFANSLRIGLFQVVSFITGTGLTLTPFLAWPNFLLALLVALPLVGSCSSSLSGGIKIYRIGVLRTQIKRTIRQCYEPNENDELHSNRLVMSAMAFVTLFLLVLVVGVLALSLAGVTPHQAIYFAITSVTTLGHNISIASYSNVEKIIMVVLMLLGRLEIYPIMVFLLPVFYKKNKIV